MLVTYYKGPSQLEPASMRVYREHLIASLKEYPHFNYRIDDWSPRFDFDLFGLHFSRIINRYLLYPKSTAKNCSEVNHVLDHTYASILKYLPKKVVKIITVHDLFLLEGKINEFRLLSLPGLYQADMIIADSVATKNMLIQKTTIAPEKVRVVYLGVDQNIFKPLINREAIRQRLGLSKYVIILSIANKEKRKNTILIVNLLKELLKEIPRLILIRVGEDNEETKQAIKQLNLERNIRYFLDISGSLLVKLYNIADVLILPSFNEGFGLPVLEAMACGCPVVASNTSSLPEVVGGAGLMIDPTDIIQYIKSTKEVLTNEKLRKGLVKRGFIQAKQFSWEKCARGTFASYESAIRTRHH